MKIATKTAATPVKAFNDNYIWLYPDTDNAHTAIVIDPGDAQPVLSFCKEHTLSLSAVLVTHHHYDHVNGVALLANTFNIPVYGPHSSIHQVYPQAQAVKGGDHLTINNHTFEILAVPGHTLDHISYYHQNNHNLFCGDTLFSSGCGRLFEGTAEQMLQSLSLIAALPDNTQCYCAHEYTLANLAFAQTVEPKNMAITYRINACQGLRQQGEPTIPTTLGLEKQVNPFLRCHEASVKYAVQIYADKNNIPFTAANHTDVFRLLRQWKDNF